jgi:hypothetical protein
MSSVVLCPHCLLILVVFSFASFAICRWYNKLDAGDISRFSVPKLVSLGLSAFFYILTFLI